METLASAMLDSLKMPTGTHIRRITVCITHHCTFVSVLMELAHLKQARLPHMCTRSWPLLIFFLTSLNHYRNSDLSAWRYTAVYRCRRWLHLRCSQENREHTSIVTVLGKSLCADTTWNLHTVIVEMFLNNRESL